MTSQVVGQCIFPRARDNPCGGLEEAGVEHGVSGARGDEVLEFRHVDGANSVGFKGKSEINRDIQCVLGVFLPGARSAIAQVDVTPEIGALLDEKEEPANEVLCRSG